MKLQVQLINPTRNQLKDIKTIKKNQRIKKFRVTHA